MEEKNKPERTCFIIMPLGSPEDFPISFTKDIYDKIIKPIFEKYNGLFKYKCELAESPQSGSILEFVLKKLFKSDLVVADLTDYNPNVFWELGIRYAFKPSGTILIYMKGDEDQKFDFPFDVQDLNIFAYSPFNYPRYVGPLRKKIHACLHIFETQPENIDSPIYSRNIGNLKSDRDKVKILEEENTMLQQKIQESVTSIDIQELKTYIKKLEESLSENKIDLPTRRLFGIEE